MTKRGSELRAPACDSALDLVEAILETTKNGGSCGGGGEDEQARLVREEILAHVHNIFST